MTDKQDLHDPNGAKGLVRLKNQLRRRYLGKCGIHGLGVRHDADAICVYVTPGDTQQDEALRQLRIDVQPHALVVVVEPPAKAD